MLKNLVIITNQYYIYCSLFFIHDLLIVYILISSFSLLLINKKKNSLVNIKNTNNNYNMLFYVKVKLYLRRKTNKTKTHKCKIAM